MGDSKFVLSLDNIFGLLPFCSYMARTSWRDSLNSSPTIPERKVREELTNSGYLQVIQLVGVQNSEAH